MPLHFFESKLFSIAIFFATLSVVAAMGFIFYPKYQAEAQLKFYTPSTGAVKISEEVKVTHRSNKSGSWREHVPCITLKLTDASAPITACKVTGFIDSPEEAKQFLASNFGSASGFTVYVSPDKNKASLDQFNPERARSALLILVLVLVIVPAGNLALWFYLRRMVKKKRVDSDQ